VTALIAAALARYRRDMGAGPGYWRNNPGEPAPYLFESGGRDVAVRLAPVPRMKGGYSVVLTPDHQAARAVTLNDESGADMTLTIDGLRRRVVLASRGDEWWVWLKSDAIRLKARPLLPEPRRAADAGGSLRAPLPGRVVAVLVEVGQAVAEGQPLLKVEAMKMEHTIRAAAAGVVAAIHCAVGEQVNEGETLARIEDH
jgi:biotin carboxyl carrier protein